MRVHYVQHVPFEGIGAIEDWIHARGHDLSGTQVFRAPARTAAGEPAALGFPDPEDLDLLVVMGGPMSIYESAEYPWLELEKAFIKRAVDSGRLTLGICLGAQLIADVLGGPVTKAPLREIGWWPVELTPAGRAAPLFADLPERFTALHWHGDTFAIPPGAAHLATSEACPNQAFALDGGRVLGLQFHLEETRASLEMLADNAGNDLDTDASEPWVMTRLDLLRPDAPYDQCRDLLFSLLDRMSSL